MSLSLSSRNAALLSTCKSNAMRARIMSSVLCTLARLEVMQRDLKQNVDQATDSSAEWTRNSEFPLLSRVKYKMTCRGPQRANSLYTSWASTIVKDGPANLCAAWRHLPFHSDYDRLHETPGISMANIPFINKY